MATISCMGGWCSKREMCRLYHATGAIVAERLCEVGANDAFEPVRIVRKQGTWERKAPGLANAKWFEAVH